MKKILISQLIFFKGEDFQVSGYQIDSRCVETGDLFFAIRGNKVDGHDFLEDVAKRGAIGAVVREGYQGPDYGLHLLRVECVEEFLKELASISFKKAPIPVIGITGSVGKTTTKDFTATLLMARFRVHKTKKSQNSKLTLPLTVLNRSCDDEVLVLEMGMSEKGDLKRHVSIAPPTVAVLTNIALVHAAYFPDGLKEIAKAKAEIFSHIETKSAIFDRDFIQYNESVDCEENVAFSQDDLPKEFAVFQEEHFLHNLTAAYFVAKKMGLSHEEIALQISKLQTPKMRFEKFEKNGIHFINDAYNAGPDSMKAALKSLKLFSGRKIAVLGSMKELGKFCKKAHQEVGFVAEKNIDYLFAFGGEARELFNAFIESGKPAEFFLEKKELIQKLKQTLRKGDVVLVKGSRSLEMEEVISACSFG